MNNKQIVEDYYKSVGETPAIWLEYLQDNEVQIIVNVIKKELWVVLSEPWYWALNRSDAFYNWYPTCIWEFKHDKDIIEKDILIAKIKQWFEIEII